VKLGWFAFLVEFGLVCKIPLPHWTLDVGWTARLDKTIKEFALVVVELELDLGISLFVCIVIYYQESYSLEGFVKVTWVAE
jgi:hypothetical protein